MSRNLALRKLPFRAFSLLLIVLFTRFSAARVHTATGGNFSAPSTWQDGMVPSCSGGETVVVATGAILTGDVSCTLGSKTQPVGPAIHLLNGSQFAPSANTVWTLQGLDTTANQVAVIDLGAQFIPQPASTILSDCATDGRCVIVNNGYLKSVNVTWSIPASNLHWNNSESYTFINKQYLDRYTLPNVWVAQLKRPWISNSQGSGLGSASDSSVSFLNAPQGSLLTEVSSLPQVTSPGAYYINYDAGVVYFYLSTTQELQPSQGFGANYQYLSFIGGTIVSTNNAAGNQIIVDHSNFGFMGTISADNAYVLNLANKQSTSVGSNRLAQVTNNTFRYCKRIVGITGPVNGTASDPILLTGNTVYAVQGDGWGTVFSNSLTNSSYVAVRNNIVPNALWGSGFVSAISHGVANTLTGWTIQNNIVHTYAFELDTPLATVWPDSVISGNFILGFSGGFDGREISGFGGTPGHPTVIDRNVFVHAHRVINVASNQNFTNNYIADYDHHGVNGPTVWGNTQVTNVQLMGNIFTGGVDMPTFQLGYTTNVWLDNVLIAQNTSIHRTQGGLEFGDQGDGYGSSLLTNLKIYNNLFPSSAYGILRRPDTVTGNSRVHIYRADWCDFYSDPIDYDGFNTFATFTWNGGEYDASPNRSVTGVSLGDTNYSSPQSGFTVNWTYTSAANITVSWNQGTPVQLVAYSGEVSSATNNTDDQIPGLYSGTLTDLSKSFPTALNDPGVPAGMWVKITGGRGAGQVRRVTSNTAHVLTLVPAWTTIPDTSSSYVLVISETKLLDHNGSNYVVAGVDLRSTPLASASDVGIGVQFNTVNAAPLFLNSNASWRTWDIQQGGTGGDDSAFNRLSSNPALVLNLLTYEKLGFTPKNPMLSHGWNNQYIGAVSAGGFGPP